MSGPATNTSTAAPASGSSSRRWSIGPQFGLKWNAPLPTGGFVLGNDVKLTAELELVQAEDA